MVYSFLGDALWDGALLLGDALWDGALLFPARSQPVPGESYVTVDPAQRLKRHNSSGGAKATKNNRP
jgi:hypothetical protein